MPSDEAAFAANWRTVLAVDAGLGVAVTVAGIALALVVQVALGAVLAAAGVVYVALVARRARRWRRLRGQAGGREG